jgi:hypothetical protein
LLTNEELGLKADKDRFDAGRKVAEALLGRMSTELQKVSLIEMRLATRTGWGETAIKFVREAADKQLAIAAKFQGVINAAIVFLDVNPSPSVANKQEYVDWAVKLESEASTVEAGYKAFVREVLGDFIKLAGIKPP